jgi:hypothetical protein
VEELLSFLAFVLFEVILVTTGRLVVRGATLGRWRGEQLGRKESRVFAAAGALSFVRDGRRVITSTGLLFIGLAFYVALITLVVLL